MKVKSLRRHVKGRGTIRARKISISVTRRAKTCVESTSKQVGSIVGVRLNAERTRQSTRETLHVAVD